MGKFSAAAGAIFLAVAASATASAQDTGKIVLGWTPDLQTTPIVVAMEKGFFKQAGLDVKSVNFVSGRDALEALLGGQLDLAFMAEFPPTIGALQKQAFRVVTTLSQYHGNRIISTSTVGFHTVKDLAGKRVGTTMGSNAGYFTELALKNTGVKATIVNVGPADIVPALARGDIDAGVPFPDFYPKAKELLGDKYREEISKDYIAYFVVSASLPLIDKRPGDLKKFLSALIKGDEYLHAHPAEAQQMVATEMKGVAKLPEVQAQWAEYVYAVGLDKGLLALMTDEGKWITARGLIKSAEADPALFRTYLDDAPIKTLDAKRDDLPPSAPVKD